jgi:hypothetical protein
VSGSQEGLLAAILGLAQAQGNLNLRPDQLSLQGQTLTLKFTADDIKSLILSNMTPEARARFGPFIDVKIENGAVIVNVRL